MNISPTVPYGDWTPFWDAFDWTGPGGFKTQIDLAKSVGCNGIRIVVRCGHGVWTGTSTLSQLFAKMTQVINYCLSLGMWYYGSMEWPIKEASGNNPPHTDFASASNDISAYSATFCRFLASFPNVLGCDLANEFVWDNRRGSYVNWNSGNNLTTEQVQTLMAQCIAAIRSVAPRLALSGSFAYFNDPDFQYFAYLFDYLDCHGYGNYPPYVYIVPGTDQKQIFVGEIGYPMSTFPRTSQLQATYDNYMNFAYPPGQPGCVGLDLFCVVPFVSIAPQDDYGIWYQSGADRGDLAPYYAQYPVQTPLFSFPKTGWGM